MLTVWVALAYVRPAMTGDRLRFVRALACIAAFFSIHVAAQTTTVAGFTPGSFRVTETGAAEYRIPLQVPPGIAGMEPRLALVYNSQAGNGLLGVGWNLEGLSAITRCPRTVAQDGVRGAINYDWNDRYCLDGQRLMAINESYGADATEYRTERESFSKIVSYGIAGNGPAWFKVWTKSGQILEYGNTADSRIEAQGKSTVRVWAVNKVADTAGNYLTVVCTSRTLQRGSITRSPFCILLAPPFSPTKRGRIRSFRTLPVGRCESSNVWQTSAHMRACSWSRNIA
jgi:hypothetical protein